MSRPPLAGTNVEDLTEEVPDRLRARLLDDDDVEWITDADVAPEQSDVESDADEEDDESDDDDEDDEEDAVAEEAESDGP